MRRALAISAHGKAAAAQIDNSSRQKIASRLLHQIEPRRSLLRAAAHSKHHRPGEAIVIKILMAVVANRNARRNRQAHYATRVINRGVAPEALVDGNKRKASSRWRIKKVSRYVFAKHRRHQRVIAHRPLPVNAK